MRSSGRLREARQHYGRVCALLEGRETERFGLSGLPYSGACALDAWAAVELGHGAEALDLLERGQRVADRAGHLYSQAVIGVYRTWVLSDLGLAEAALGLGAATVQTCRERRFVGQTMLALLATARALGDLGRAAEGLPLAQECIALQQSTGAESNRALMLQVLADLQVGSGRLDEAEATVREGCGFVARHGEASHGAWLGWVSGRLARARGDRAGAGEAWRTALEQANGLGLALLTAHCRLALGALHRDLGEVDAARRALGEAAATYRAIGATPRALEADAALAAL
jgi:tetratricopeptide (TPR) repeat protein